MEAITSTLADALSKSSGETEVPEDAGPPLDLSDERGPASAERRGQQAGPISADPFNTATSANPGGGFIPPSSLRLPDTAPSDPEIPELPREEIDDIVPATQQHAASQYRPTGIVESRHAVRPSRSRAEFPSNVRSGWHAGDRHRAAPDSAAAPRTLEDTVREMLRPLLVQWLNENMPRIINEALRDELAAAGLNARLDDKRA